MDELIHHCIHEISFDGDLGCKVSRLRDLIIDFYSRSEEGQNVDEAFCAFVWSAVVQQPAVRIGIVPPGVTSSVYIAPQRATQRKSKNNEETQENAQPTTLQVIPDAAIHPLTTLVQQYGENLRIAVDPETVFVAITGSHARPTKLTPMVYTALQLIARGRDQGLSTVDLSSQTGYDAKTAHYLVEKLLELDLIVKRKKSGVGGNLCIHKYCFERSTAWQKVLAEEAEAQAVDLLKVELDDEPGAGDDPEGQSQIRTDLGFGPIDCMHLSSLPLVRARVVKLLKHSPHNLHTTQNLVVTLGFAHPTKTERRFFATRLREMMTEKIIEKVQVPHPTRKTGVVTCIRLLSPSEGEGTIGTEGDAPLDVPESCNSTKLKANVSIHKQIIDIIDRSGPEGITLTELSKVLCNFDRRIIELLLTRLERTPPPAHLSDLAITASQETHGRERRFRYYTLANYRQDAEKQGTHPDYDAIDISQAGDYLPVDQSSFYTTTSELNDYVNKLKLQEDGAVSVRGKAKATPKPPPKYKTPKEPATPKPKAPKVFKNPILPDGSVKRGRPRKEWAGQRGQKRKRDDVDQADPDTAESASAPVASVPSATEPTEPPAKKRRGRPPKRRVTQAGSDSMLGDQDAPMVTEQVAQSQPDIVMNLEPRMEGAAEGAGNSVSMVSRTEVNGFQNATSLPSSNVPLAGAGPSHPTLQSAIVASSSAAAAQVSSSLSDFPVDVDQEVAMQILESISALSRPGQSQEVPIDPALMQGSSVDGPSQMMAPLLSLSDLLPMSATEMEPVSETSKRAGPESISSARPLKRARTKTIPNVSQARREKEIMRLIEEAGGILNTSTKDFPDAHAALVETMSKEGEAVSLVAGSRMDRRTLETTLKALEERGKLKVVSTVISNEAGLSRPVRIVFLPETSQEALRIFLEDLGRNLKSFLPAAPIKTLDEPVTYGGLRQKSTAPSNTLSSIALAGREKEIADKVFEGDDESIRKTLLTERNTVSQYYGGLLGRTARARELHFVTTELFEKGGHSSNVVSLEHRILDISYYFDEISIAAYCSIVACLVPNEELLQLLKSPDGRKTPVASIPQTILTTLQPGKSRSNTRIQDLLEILHALGLATPLHPTSSGSPFVRVAAHGQHPTAFNKAPLIGLPPQYWQFHTTASIRLWALSITLAPFWKEMPVSTMAEAAEYWSSLERASIDESFAKSLTDLPQDRVPTVHVPDVVIRGLRRPRDWNTQYNLSWYQMEYLRTFVDKSSGKTPLEDEDGGQSKLARICYVVCAPEDTVRQFYAREHERYGREKTKLHRKQKDEERAKRKAVDSAALAKRAAEAKEQREHDWDELVLKVHPEPLQGSAALRVRRLRSKFLQSSGVDMSKWESEVRKAIEEVNVTAKKIISSSRQTLGSALTPSAPAPIPNAAALERSVDELIDLLRSAPARPEKVKKSKPKKGEKRAFDEPKERRYRFQWNSDYDELARDASVIIKSRCKNKRLDWTGLAQIFEPTVPRNSVRQRIVRLLRDTPGGEAYARRLEDKWHDLWIRHRGTDVLPDDDPDSPSNFDLPTHIKFLRSHIDKNALRVGIVDVEDARCFSLPASVEELNRTLNVIEKESTVPTFDFMWTDPADDARDRRFTRMALVTEGNEVPLRQVYANDSVYVADASLKMVLGTPKETYDAEVAAVLLKSVGEHAVKEATNSMLERGILSKVVRDPSKPRPGRTLKIAEANITSLGGPFQSDVFHDAIAQEEELLAEEEEDENVWREWSLLATDGDIASLLELVSDGKVEFKLDTSHAQSVRPVIDWNSKKTDDDDIENVIYLRYAKTSQLPHPTSPKEPINIESSPTPTSHSPGSSDTPHGLKSDGQPACCSENDAILVDCVGCLAGQAEITLGSLSSPEDGVAKRILDALHEVSGQGLSKDVLLSQMDDIPPSMISTVIDRLTSATIPLAFWTGYSRIVLVSSKFLDAWTVPIPRSEGVLTRVFPRRWLDIHGRELTDVLEAAHKAVMSIILFKPGVTQTEIRWQLRSVYDRQEINDLLCHLSSEGFIKRTTHDDSQLLSAGPPDDDEEYGVFWKSDSAKHWYTVR